MSGLRLIPAALALCLAAPAFAQAGYQPPRTADGKPDFQGVWTNAALTKLERPAGIDKLVVTQEEADRIDPGYGWKRMRAEDSTPTDPNAGAPSDGDTEKGYNAFWIDPGASLGVVKGEFRTSWIVDPPNGKVPYTPFAQGQLMRAFGQMSGFSDPEQRPASERCITGFGSTAGPPMLNVLYNNHYRIVQTPSHVMILVEMNHDARIIPIVSGKEAARHSPDDLRRWLGEPIGWWEGDTLVVETTNFHPGDSIRADMDGFLFMSPDSKVTERFTRVSEREVFYEFKVEDPKFFTMPWKGEMSFYASSEPLYEYACHEGNYAMPGILEGARKAERDAAQKAAVAKPSPRRP